MAEHIAVCEDLLADKDSESDASGSDNEEESPAKPKAASNPQSSLEHWNTVLEYLQGWPIAFYSNGTHCCISIHRHATNVLMVYIRCYQ